MRLLAASALAALGCDPLADGTYVGEPIITFEGTFSETSRLVRVDGKLALLWQDARGAGGPGAEVTVLPFVTSSLGSFTAAVPVPPASAAMFGFDDGGPQLGEAYVHVVTGVPITTADLDLGLDPVHVVVFADHDVVDGDAAGYLGGPVTAGYHLRRFTMAAAVGPAQRQLIERCVASTGDRVACESRRGYQLDPADDTESLHIMLRVR
jgi:hypothetical protein